jgi:hypothetical protein
VRTSRRDGVRRVIWFRFLDEYLALSFYGLPVAAEGNTGIFTAAGKVKWTEG